MAPKHLNSPSPKISQGEQKMELFKALSKIYCPLDRDEMYILSELVHLIPGKEPHVSVGDFIWSKHVRRRAQISYVPQK